MKTLLPILNRIEKIHALYIATFLFFLTLFIYGNTLGNGLFYDDEQFIYKNTFVQSFDVRSFFTKNVDAGAGVISNYYRPLLLLTFGLEHLLVGDTAFLYHLTSLLFHAGAGIVLFLVLKKITKSTLLSLCTTVFFIIHPIQTEAVAYVSGRGDPMGMFFMLLSILLSFTVSTKQKIISYLFFICALLSKELTIITPIMVLLCHLAYLDARVKANIIAAIKTALPYIAINIVYIFLRLTVLNFDNTLNFYNSHNLYSDSLYVRLLTFLSLIPSYLSLLVYPKELFIDRSAAIVTQPTLSVALTFLCILGLVVGCFLWYKKSVIPLFAVLLFFTAFIPTSGVIPINGIFYEHFLYYPSIGIFLFFSYLLYLLIANSTQLMQRLLVSILVLIFCLLCLRTMIRNTDWHDPITFYTQTISHTKSARIYNNLAMSYADTGEQAKAVAMYKQAILLGDFYPQSHYNLANSYADLGDIQSAEKEYKNALTLDPYFYLAYIRLYSLYNASNQRVKQAEIIKQVTEITQKNPNFQPVLLQLQQM